MRRYFCLFFFYFFSTFFQSIFAQGFGIPDEACPANPINFTSPEPNASVHDWDFCTGDLLQAPQASLLTAFINDPNTPQADAHAPEHMTMVFDGINWYGFIVNITGESIIRADFGNSLDNIPSYKNLGNIGNILDNPLRLKIVKDGDNWYGFIANNVTSSTGNLARINFGNSLANNNPTATNFPSAFKPFMTTIHVIRENGDWIVIAWGAQSTATKLFNFGNSLSNSPLSEFTLSEAKGLMVDIIRADNKWVGILAGANLVGLVDFGTSIYSGAVRTFYSTPNLPLNVSEVIGNLRLIKDGNNYFAFILALSGNLYRLDFGSSIFNPNPVVTNFGNFGLLGQQNLSNRPSIAFTMAKHQSEWYAFAINRHPNNIAPSNENQLIKIKFPNNCNASLANSSLVNPIASFSKNGKNIIQLETYDANRNFLNSYTDSTNILEATVGNFSFNNQCLGEPAIFNNLSLGADENVSSWSWDFGDGQSSGLKTPSHSYTNPGLYQAKLTVNNSSGCSNTIIKSIRISSRPNTDFIVKSVDCGTGIVEFEDISSLTNLDKSAGGFISERYWLFGDDRQLNATPAATRTIVRKGDPNYYTFIPAYQPGNYTVSLTITDEAGCSSTASKLISVKNQDAPIASFSHTTACQGFPVNFTDLSILPAGVAGEINSWLWSFGGTGSSTQKNPIHTFPNTGTFQVSLTVRNSLGCSNFITIPVEVKASIQSLFTSSLESGNAPLSVNFANQSIGAVGYNWDFGDGFKSADESPSHTFTKAGIYTVKFQAKNSIGCGTLITKTINVLESPNALEESALNRINIYPNPGEGKFFIKLKDNLGNETNFKVFSVTGKEIYQSTAIPDETHQLDLTHLKSGMYLLRIEQKGQFIIKKIIKN